MGDHVDALKAWRFLLDWHGLEAELIEIKEDEDESDDAGGTNYEIKSRRRRLCRKLA